MLSQWEWWQLLEEVRRDSELVGSALVAEAKRRIAEIQDQALPWHMLHPAGFSMRGASPFTLQ
jgi:hypothetical protein